MSLISDTSYLLHSLRLSYLRDVEDPYGPRIITLDPAYNSNPFIAAAGLADPERWPELNMPSSPPPSDDESERPSGFPGARLKYTQTIMGNRSGGLGLRVHGKRESTSKRLSQTPRQADVQNFVSGHAPVQEALSTSVPVTSTAFISKSPPMNKPAESSSFQPRVHIQEPSAVVDAPVQKVVQFVPKFRGAKEMEAKRKARIAARRARGGAPPPQSRSPNPELSSSDEEPTMAEEISSDSDFGKGVSADVDSMDEGDSFELEYPSVQPEPESASAVLSFSPKVIPMSSPPDANDDVPSNVSPVDLSRKFQSRPETKSSVLSPGVDSLAGMSFQMLTPMHSVQNDSRKPPSGAPAGPRTRASSKGGLPSTNTPAQQKETLFPRKMVQPIQPQKSALSAMLASEDSSSNPFSELYASISGRGEGASEDVTVYFPHATEPRNQPMELNVRKDATVEEVIGYALWTYWKEGWIPRIDEGLKGEDDPQWATKVSAVGWILRIAEEDGEVDDDFPPPDRLGKLSKFNGDAYAVLPASSLQVQQNQLIESKIQRHPSRVTRKMEKLVPPGPVPVLPGPSTSALGTLLGSVPLSTSLGPSTSHGPQMFLRIRSADVGDAVPAHISTTIPVTAGMYMQEALELVCRKRKLSNPNEYALLVQGLNMLIPLDRTVASLSGKWELLLVKRSVLQQVAPNWQKVPGKTTDPNASIFKRMSDTPEMQFQSSDLTGGYKKYTIYRKAAPMLLSRQERGLAIDGAYIHIMPSSNKAMRAAVFETGRTTSYHIKSIADIQQSSKYSSVFKLVLNRGGHNKRYDFEADSPALAAEIVQTIKGLKATLDRSGTVNKSRRSKQVV